MEIFPTKKCPKCGYPMCPKCYGQIRWVKTFWRGIDQREVQKITKVQDCLCIYGLEAKLFKELLINYKRNICYDCFMGTQGNVTQRVYGHGVRWTYACMKKFLKQKRRRFPAISPSKLKQPYQEQKQKKHIPPKQQQQKQESSNEQQKQEKKQITPKEQQGKKQIKDEETKPENQKSN